jgi:hypothetical protein
MTRETDFIDHLDGLDSIYDQRRQLVAQLSIARQIHSHKDATRIALRIRELDRHIAGVIRSTFHL